MAKKLLPILIVAAICISTLFSCRKSNKSTSDQTLNYFPIKLGKFVTYAVDSTVYVSGLETKLTKIPVAPGDTIYQVDTIYIADKIETRSQAKYVITDTFRDNQNRLSYIMDIFTRSRDGGIWKPSRVVTLTPEVLVQTTTTPPAGTPLNGLLYGQDGIQFEKLVFPIIQGQSWLGNRLVPSNDPDYTLLKNWNYTYQNVNHSYNNGYVNYDNTVTVLENDESVNYPTLDSALYAYRIYAKEVYAYNVGMVYKEYTNWTYQPYSAKAVTGYTVIMRALDHN